MSTKVTTTNYKNLNGQLLLADLESSNSQYYFFVGDHSNTVLSSISDDVFDIYENPYSNMIFGKKVTTEDTRFLIKNNLYVANTVYAMYDDRDQDLKDKSFFVQTLEGSFYHIWKVVDNNQDNFSTIQPLFSNITGGDNGLFQTSDGYRWKYMTSVNVSDFDLFATATLFPVVANNTVSANSIPGAIEIIKINDQGRGYHNYIDGVLHTNDIFINGSANQYNISNSSVVTSNGYYTGCIVYITSGAGVGQFSTIVDYTSNSLGNIIRLDNSFPITPQNNDQYEIRPLIGIQTSEGQQTINCIARALVNSQNSNSIYRIEVLQAGVNYRGATANVIANSVVGVQTQANVRPVFPPPGGHGANVFSELYSKDLSLTITFDESESNTIPISGSYQQFGLIRNPSFANVGLGLGTFNSLYQQDETVYILNPIPVQSNVSVSIGNNQIVGNTSTLFTQQFAPNSFVYILSGDGTGSQISQVNSATNNAVLVMNDNSLFSCSAVTVYIPNIITQGTVSVVSNSTNITVNNIPGNWQTQTSMVGAISGSTASVNTITRNEESKTFDTFVQSYKYIVTVNSGTFTQTESVQGVSNNQIFASIQSYTGSGTLTLYLNNFMGGRFNVSDTFRGITSGAVATVTKVYQQELVYNSGDILYVENINPVTRANNQQETINIIFNF